MDDKVRGGDKGWGSGNEEQDLKGWTQKQGVEVRWGSLVGWREQCRGDQSKRTQE